jgi:ACT domain-containing protein
MNNPSFNNIILSSKDVSSPDNNLEILELKEERAGILSSMIIIIADEIIIIVGNHQYFSLNSENKNTIVNTITIKSDDREPVYKIIKTSANAGISHKRANFFFDENQRHKEKP